MRQELSKEQSDIAFYNNCEGPLLVEASAGSGKTRILTERVRHLLSDKEDKFFSVLCLTFTNKAAEEMKLRLEEVPKLNDRVFIGNFHGFCLNEIIRKHRQEIGLEEIPQIFDVNDSKKILEEVFLQNAIFDNDYKNLEPRDQQDRLNDYLKVISTAKQDLVVNPEIDASFWTEKRKVLYNEYNDRMRNQNAMNYDDILLYAYRILSERPAIANIYRRTYRYILVDEAQDLNFAQYHILKAICGDTHRNLMMVGDQKQAIYAFNGASIRFMQEDFVKDFEATKLNIPHNYRSSTKVLELANHIRPNGGMPNNYFEGVGEINSLENEKLESEWIISKIREIIAIGFYEEKEIKIPIKLENIAILARNKFVFKELIHQLDEDEFFKSQYYLRTGIEKFIPESQLIKVFDLGLRILVNPADVLHFNQLCQELKIPITETKQRIETLLNVNQHPELSPQVKEWLDEIVEFWKKLNIQPKLVSKVLQSIKEKLRAYNFADEELLKIDYDINEFLKLWKGFIKNTPSENQNLANFRYFIALNSIDENKEGLTLATVHTVKGLEFDIVFVMGMNQGILPYYKAKDEKSLAQERNNAYVAVTRAKKSIYISYPQNRIMPWGDSKRQLISSFIKYFLWT